MKLFRYHISFGDAFTDEYGMVFATGERGALDFLIDPNHFAGTVHIFECIDGAEMSALGDMISRSVA